FAVVASLVSVSARGNPQVEDFARTIRGRIEALGRAHDYVRPVEWEMAGSFAEPRHLHGLLEGLLAAYRGGAAERLIVTGDDPTVGPAAATA
ncbi:hypothetical protein ELO20_30020, partial [Klebsiella pneumoniae]|nr:hypothetical protein [Klebsiella pneumoniae]